MYGNKLIKLIFMLFHSLWSYHAEAEYKMECDVNAHFGKAKKKKEKINPIYPFVMENVFW